MSDKSIDITRGEIYIARNKITNKAYVGQAQKYLNSGQKWGHVARWMRHGLEATTDKNVKGKYTLINDAIREHGMDSFELTKICDCNLSEMDGLESQYIKEYNTLDPDGYNMTSGGKTGTHSETSNKKKLVRKAYSEEAKLNMGKASLGRRYEQKARKHETDSELPKYVHAIRVDGVIIGYQVKKFPIGIEKKEYVYKTFKRKYDLEGALKDATEYVQKLQQEYDAKLAAHKKQVQEEKESAEQAKTMKLPDLPANIYPLIKEKLVLGYYVKGLKDCNGNNIPRRDFIENTNSYNLDHAKKYVAEVSKYNRDNIVPDNWLTIELSRKYKSEDLPKHIRCQYYNGEEIGYRVDFFVKYDENKKKVMEVKSFCNKKLTMDAKLDKAKAFVEEMKIKHNKQ